jgi:hypothetical protein
MKALTGGDLQEGTLVLRSWPDLTEKTTTSGNIKAPELHLPALIWNSMR